MASTPLPENEKERLLALETYHIFDTGEEKDYDALTSLASVICQIPIALITFIDEERQWFKSHYGTDFTENQRALSLCTHLIASGEEIMIVPDANLDERFTSNPMVTGPTKVTFYAGVPLVNEEGFALGTLCVIDQQPRTLNEEQIEALKTLARQVVNKVELRRKIFDLEAAKSQLTANAILLKTQLNALPQIAWTNTIDGEVDFYNQKWFDYTGLTFEESKAWGWQEVIHPEDLEYNLTSYRNMLQSGTGGEFEIREKGIDGVFRWHLARMTPIKDIDGNIKQWIGTATDIHELKEANEKVADARQQLELTVNALSISQANFSGIILQAPVAMGLFLGEEMKLEVINVKLLELWDKDASIVGKALIDVLPEMVGQPYPQIMLDVYHNGIPYFGNEAKVDLYRSGQLETGYYNFINQPFKNNEGKIAGIIVVAIEVTDQVNARNELERVYEQARLSKEAAQLGTFDMDLILGTMEWDDRCRTLFGISHHDKVTYDDDFVPGLHPDDKDRIVEIINNVFIKSRTGGIYDVEYRTIGVEDKKLRWVRAKGQVYFDNDEIPLRFIGSVLDITEQKQDELRKNDFIGMVSHELKTPLTSLTAIIQLLNVKMKSSSDDFIPVALEKANSQVKKMNSMVNGFLNLSRLEAGKIDIVKTRFDMEKLIGEIIADSTLIVASHTIRFEPCGSFMVNADYDKIGSVVTNLISNAVKYSPKGKEIEVKCSLANDQVTVSVKDEGMGIKPQDRDRLFERYYRVQSNHTQNIAGFGIGLYLCAEIIERHDGKIGVDSESGKGSIFYFSLPVNSN